jgi:adenylylsulfate kinase
LCLERQEFLKVILQNNVLGSGFKLHGWCVWVTGLPGSGKSMVSEALSKLLKQKGIHAQLLASDHLRKVLTPKPTYSLEERDTVYTTLVYVAKLLTQNNVNVIIDATGNLRRYRENARKQIPHYIEAYLECPIEVCIQRETKRGKTHKAPRKIYKRAHEGKAPTVPGIGQPYQPPLNPEVTINTTKTTPEQAAQEILHKLREKELLIFLR